MNPQTAALVAATALVIGACESTPAAPHALQESDATAPENPFRQTVLDTQYVPWGLVAHALGEIDGKPYTNSREAFERSYARGFRVFEVDLVMLADESVWTVHDRFEARYGLEDRFDRLTSADLVEARLFDKYAPMRIDDFLRRVDELGDVWVVLDTKVARPGISRAKRIDLHVETVRNIVKAAPNKAVLDRLVPHIGNGEDLRRIRNIHPFPNFMFAIYRSDVFEEPNWTDDQIAEFVRKNEIGAVMMWWNKRYEREFADRLKAAGAAVYVHSLDDRAEIERFRALGLGVYSDGVMLEEP